MMSLAPLLSPFCSCETVHDVDIQGFVTLPLQFNNDSGEKHPQRSRSVYIQVCQPTLFSHPSCQCLLCITAKKRPPSCDGPRTASQPLKLIQRFDQSPRLLSAQRLRGNTGEMIWILLESSLIWRVRTQSLYIACHAPVPLTWPQSKHPPKHVRT